MPGMQGQQAEYDQGEAKEYILGLRLLLAAIYRKKAEVLQPSVLQW